MFKNFRNVCIYRLSRDHHIDPGTLEEQLKALEFTPCGSHDLARTGFIPPLPGGESLSFTASDYTTLTIQCEKKIIPSPVIKEALNKRIEALEQNQGRKLKKTEKDALKDEVLHTLIPRAFSKSERVSIIYSAKTERLFINASPSKCENALALLRKALGSLPVVPLTIESPIELTFTDWVRSETLPAGFTMGEKAELKAILEDGGQARLTKQDLGSDEVKTMIEAGKLVTKLALDFQSRVTFALNDSAGMTELKFSDELLDQNSDIESDDALQRVSADVLLLAGELDSLTTAVIAALGGEAKR